MKGWFRKIEISQHERCKINRTREVRGAGGQKTKFTRKETWTGGTGKRTSIKIWSDWWG